MTKEQVAESTRNIVHLAERFASVLPQRVGDQRVVYEAFTALEVSRLALLAVLRETFPTLADEIEREQPRFTQLAGQIVEKMLAAEAEAR